MGNLIFEQKVFLSLLVLVTLAFGWILWPFYGAVFWAVILAILFAPLQRRLQVLFNNRRNLAALATLLASLLIAVLPVIFITGLLVQEGSTLYTRISSGELDVGAYVIQVKEMLPASIQGYLQRFGLTDMDDLRERLGSSALQGSQYLATKAFSFGQGTFQFVVSFFVMLYLLFFLIRDGRDLVARIRKALPLSGEQKKKLFEKFAQVVRATVKGNIIIAVIQGALGGLIFAILGIPSALLWGVLMAMLSLLPAVGAGLIWVPVAIYFLFSGSIVSGVVLIAFGVLVIGLVDNLLRPTLVGKDTKMPDYIVLISTLGGLALFGLNGFVIGPLIAALFIACWDLFAEREEEAGVP
ncbi:AI-2E family transporter [Stutzerimonas kirkiae]|uniref:AI-2E family transporter n=1 Tax=Stutzerimonas kirkiae TaxID=2211392 RepID=A0A4Q9RE78_9GAMM|nr:AI-2E family transporter [Stutzerimonas kirkiae]TBU99988.1 AI-2E family transporter [Stutzerimonas kirkiae]TBV05694.1 AI-2E family transporter [Stutzerimonas kirkiae]TBV10563.1 AI-2E family transporter [Stutzerimonas kirkiae]TBV17421.1 AI-2E family transporter [Stutzerimonas kirkiae]